MNHAAPPLQDPWRAARETAAAMPLVSLAIIDVDGADAATFLNGQLSSDVASLSAAHAQWTSYNSPKGRMLANPLLYRRGADPSYRMVLPTGIAEPVRKRLAMFVLRSKVSLTLSAATAALGIGGPGAAAALHAALGIDVRPLAVVAAADPAVEAIGLPDGRVLVVCEPSRVEEILARLGAFATRAPESVWRWLGIRAGVAQIGPATQDRHVAQSANWELVGGVSFTKGCYTGQEIVARTQHLGVVKERAFALRSAGVAPAPGTALYAPVFGDQACGSVLDAVDLPGGGSELLAVIQVAAADDPALRLGAVNGEPVDRLPLPYPLPASAPRRVKL